MPIIGNPLNSVAFLTDSCSGAITIEACMKDIPEGAVYEIVDTDTVPSDRTFRDAWTWA